MKILIVSIGFVLLCFFTFGSPIKVVRVIDGDTFVIATGERVRMLGINAPEMADFFGLESKHYLASLIEGQHVELEVDVYGKDRDRYQRLLRYVNLNGKDVNKAMINDGFAFAYLKFKFGRSERYKLAQAEARAKGVGIWGGEKLEWELEQDQPSNTYMNFDQHITTRWFIILVLGVILFLIWVYAVVVK